MRLNLIRLSYATISIAVIASSAIGYVPVLAQDVTPAPRRTRRAYSTMDYYNRANGGDTGSSVVTKQVKKVKRVRKPKQASSVRPHIEGTKTESSERSSTGKVSDSPTTNSTKNETKATNSVSKSSDTSESATGSARKRPNRSAISDTMIDASEPGRDESVVTKEKDRHEKTETAVDKTDADVQTASKQNSEGANRPSIDLPATKLSSIPPPQMPPPPTSIGGFESKGSAK